MKKSLGSMDLFAIALGSVIGWGAFVLPGNVFLPNAGVINTLIGFAIAVFMIFFIEKSYSLLLGIYPSVGGEYTFASETFGNKTGFATGWLLTVAYLSIIPLNATAVPMVLESITDWYSRGRLLYMFADYPVYFNDICVSLSIILLFTFVNYKGIRSSKLAQNICVFGLLFSIALIVVLSAFKVDSTHFHNLETNILLELLLLLLGHLLVSIQLHNCLKNLKLIVKKLHLAP
jgi:amino acid transporter